MSWIQAGNDLLGVVTYEEAVVGLAAAYDEATLAGQRQLAREINDARNAITNKLVLGEPDTIAAPGTVRPAQALLPVDRAVLRELAKRIQGAGLEGGRHFDPDAKEAGIGKIVQPFALGSGMILAIVALLFFWRR